MVFLWYFFFCRPVCTDFPPSPFSHHTPTLLPSSQFPGGGVDTWQLWSATSKFPRGNLQANTHDRFGWAQSHEKSQRAEERGGGASGGSDLRGARRGGRHLHADPPHRPLRLLSLPHAPSPASGALAMGNTQTPLNSSRGPGDKEGCSGRGGRGFGGLGVKDHRPFTKETALEIGCEAPGSRMGPGYLDRVHQIAGHPGPILDPGALYPLHTWYQAKC